MSRDDLDRRDRYASVLRCAAETVGGTALLAPLLRVPLADLERWVAGTEAAPLGAFLGALDFVAGGPFARRTHRVQVAVVAPAAPRTRTSAPVARSAVRVLFGLTLLFSLGLVAPAILSGNALLDLRTAAQVAASLCAAAVILGWCTRATLGSRWAGASILVTGAATICLSYLAWENTRPTLDAPAVVPAAEVHAQAPALPPIAPIARRRPQAPPLSLTPVLEHEFDDACSSMTALASLLCQERVRLDYCADREGTESMCPSVIPASLPY